MVRKSANPTAYQQSHAAVSFYIPSKGQSMGQKWDFSSFYAGVFNLRSFDLSPHLFSLILLYVSQHRSRRKLPLTHWFSLEIHLKRTERRAQVRPTCLYMDSRSHRTSGQPQIKLSLLRSISLKIRPQDFSFMCHPPIL
jgi:hypothetical protein